MSGRIPRAGFFVAASFAALAVVGGAGSIYLECADHTNRFRGPSIVLAVGIILMALVFLGEIPGRSQKIVVRLRNVVIVLCAITVACVLLLALLLGNSH